VKKRSCRRGENLFDIGRGRRMTPCGAPIKKGKKNGEEIKTVGLLRLGNFGWGPGLKKGGKACERNSLKESLRDAQELINETESETSERKVDDGSGEEKLRSLRTRILIAKLLGTKQKTFARRVEGERGRGKQDTGVRLGQDQQGIRLEKKDGKKELR